MKLYLAGPMTGIPQFNFPAFDEAAAILRADGHEVVSPAETDAPETREAALASPDGNAAGLWNNVEETYGEVLGEDIRAISDEVDAVVVMPGWQNSSGASIEAFAALRLGKPVYRIDPNDGALCDVTVEPGLLPVEVAHAGSGEVRTTSATGGQKGVKPERLDLVPTAALLELSRVYGKGAEKYDDTNYLKGYEYRKSLGALKRHVAEFELGNDYDDECGTHHLMHAAWHCFTLFTYQRYGLGVDDRIEPALAAGTLFDGEETD